jgi:CheY-like chemotaxis protein
MARLLDDLLDAARITSGKLELRRESVQIWSVLATAVETSQPLIEARGHTLVVDLPTEPVRIDADPVRLCQIVANLLNNAAKYTPNGGRIEVVARATADDVRIDVRDTGVGLTRAALERVFDLLAQVDKGEGLADDGLGIGLALVKGLTELHGGRVEATSDGPDRGATFTVVLPRPAGRKGKGHRRPAPAAAPAAPRRILVADDNRDSADSLKMLLALDGHDVRAAYSGPEALELAKTFEPEVALLDIGMPGMDGYELAGRLRDLPFRRRPLLVAVTGWGQMTDQERTLAAGFDRHLTKPIDPDEFARIPTATT